MNYKPKSREDALVLQKVDNELLIYDLTKNKAHCLNQSSALVWQLCNGYRSIKEIQKHFKRELGQEVRPEFVMLALDQLNDSGLLKGKIPEEYTFTKMSRREIVKKVGLTSVVALPIVAAIIAPTSVSAQSCGSPFGGTMINGACTENCQCAIGNPNMSGVPFAGCCGEDRGMAANNGVCRPQNFNVDAGGGCVGDGFGSS